MHKQPASLRTPIKTVRGLGAAHGGTHHFWLQRLSAVALIPLSIWFMVEVVSTLLGADRTAVALRFTSPCFALAMLAFMLALAMHARLGVQVIIEDYVHCHAKKIVLLLVVNVSAITIAATSIFAIVRLHFIGI